MRKDSTSEAEVRELGEKFSNTKKELEDTIALVAREEEDNKRLMDELEQEKREKKAEQKKKEEQTEVLKKQVATTERAMRSALQKKAQLEKEAKAKQAERSRYEEKTAKMNQQIKDMRTERDGYEDQKKTIADESEVRNKELRETNEQLQAECAQLEADLKAKRDQVKQLEDDRKKLPGGEDDAEWREKETERRQRWTRQHQEFLAKIYLEEKIGRDLDHNLSQIHAQLANLQTTFPIYNQAAAATGAEHDSSSQDQLKRRSHHSNSLSNVGYSPAPQFVGLEPLLAPTGFSATRPPPGFSQPFPDFPAGWEHMDEEDIRALTADAPLSPSATALLPSNIFTDDEHDDEDDDDDGPQSPASNQEPRSPFAPMQTASPEQDPQSPDSGRSPSVFSSPHGSSQNLPFPPFVSEDGEDKPQDPISGLFSSPHNAPGQAGPKGLASFFSRARHAKEPMEEPPQLGSLKQGQSQSFPRQTSEPDGIPRGRKTSLSNWNLFNRNSVGPDTMDTLATQNGTRGFSARSLLGFGANRAMTTVFDREQAHSRPSSIASAELPRPSTDSGSLWPPSDFPRSRLPWSPEPSAWSRNPSRRPSLHGSPSALKTTLASADDEILDEEDLMDPQVSPSQVGVIGRGPVKKSLAKALNPAAPSFMGAFFKPKADKDGGKEKAKSKDKARGTSEDHQTPPASNESVAERSESRLSLSVQSRTSVCESHDSMSLDRSFSNTPSEPLKDPVSPDSVVRKLFRKGSSSKFSLSSRLGGSMKSKGGPSSTTTNTSEREQRLSFGGSDDVLGNTAAGGDESLLGKSFDSVNSSPSIGATKAKSGRWFSMGKKKEKGKESLDMERESPGGIDSDAVLVEE